MTFLCIIAALVICPAAADSADSSPSFSATMQWLLNYLPTELQATDEYSAVRQDVSYTDNGCTLKIDSKLYTRQLQR